MSEDHINEYGMLRPKLLQSIDKMSEEPKTPETYDTARQLAVFQMLAIRLCEERDEARRLAEDCRDRYRDPRPLPWKQ